MSEETKNCPYCGEEILSVAIKCKYCGEFLNDNMSNIIKKCPYCGEEINSTAQKCKHCGEWLNKISPNSTIKKIADYQKTSNIVWLVIAIVQICSIIGIIAGIWNLIATISNWSLPQKILNQDEDIPQIYESVTGLVVIAIVNLLLGGIIGVALIIFNFYIRQLILENDKLFVRKITAENLNNVENNIQTCISNE